MNDPQWTQKFYAALGSEKSAALISATVEAQTYGPPGVGVDPAAVHEGTKAVLKSLKALQASGNFSQTDMNHLVDSMAKQNFEPNVAIELFGKSTNNDLKEMFVRAAIHNGDDKLDTAASQVLASMPIARQIEILKSLPPEKLDNFIKGAMVGETQVPSLLNASGMDPERVTFGGVGQLLANAAPDKAGAAAYPPELQNSIFHAVIQGLDDPQAFDTFKDNKEFKDNLSKIFIANRDQLLMESQVNGAVTPNGENELEHFFQFTLMTPPKGKSFDDLSLSVFKFFNEAAKALNDPQLSKRDRAAYVTFQVSHQGMTPEDFTEMVGGVLGTIVDAAGMAQESINNDNKQKQADIQFFTGLAFSLVPGVGGALAGGIAHQTLQQFVERAANYAQGQIQDNLQGTIDEALSSLNSDDRTQAGTLADTIYRQIYQDLPNGDSPNGDPQHPLLDLRGNLESGFSNTSRYTSLADARLHP